MRGTTAGADSASVCAFCNFGFLEVVPAVTASAPKNLWKMGGNYMTQDEVFNAADVNPWLEKKIFCMS